MTLTTLLKVDANPATKEKPPGARRSMTAPVEERIIWTEAIQSTEQETRCVTIWSRWMFLKVRNPSWR